MFIKRSVIAVIGLILALSLTVDGLAQGEADLSQACAWEQYVDVYISGQMDVGSISCKVSNQPATVVDGGLLADKGVTVRTTILVDISKSIPTQMREKIMALIELLIAGISKNEQYRLVAFGEQLSVLQDFASDRYDLAVAAEKMEFTGMQSKIYDAVYNTIPKIQPIDGNPCYYRTILITDGIDDTASGITKEELYLRLQAEHYPVDVIAVSAAKQAEPTKELAALVRISGGRYFNLNGETELQEFSSNIAVGSIFWLRAEIPGNLLDGSTRQFDISDGTNMVQFDFKVPVFEMPVSGTPAPNLGQAVEPDVVVSPAPGIEAVRPSPKRDRSHSDDSERSESEPASSGIFGEYAIAVYNGAGIVLILLLAVLVAVIVVRGKKKSGVISGVSITNGTAFNQKTEIIDADLTNAGATAGGNDKLCVRLRNISNPDQIWEISLSGGVLIGRDAGCQVCIDEKSMSRRQCRLYIDATGAPTAENLSSSNITLLNGEPLTAPRRISERDKLKCGRVTLMIDSIYSSSSGNVGNINKMTEFVNV